MLLLEPANRILAETVGAQIRPEEDVEDTGKPRKREPIDVRLCDFDDVSYRVVIDAKDRDSMKVSMSLPCYAEIKDKGAEDEFKRVYGDFACDPDDGFDLTVNVPLNDIKDHEKIIKDLSLMKTIVLGGVFKHYIDALKNKKLGDVENFKFDLRADTTVFIVPGKEKVTFIFGIQFMDRVDKVVGKIFMQEFQDARKTLRFAPSCQFDSLKAPAELQAFGIDEVPDNTLGYLTFGVMPNHCARDEQLLRVVEVLQSFRNFVQYHIKCGKSYFHSRMRAKSRELIKILNRAKQKTVTDPDAAPKKKKTASGRTFTRK